MPTIPNPRDIERLLKRPSYRPLRAREIFKRLRIPKENRRILKKVLNKMVHVGKILRIRGGRYVLPEKLPDLTKHDLPISYSNKKGRKIIGKFIRTGKTGIILPRNMNTQHIVVQPGDFKGIRKDSLVVAELEKRNRTYRDNRASVVEVLGKAGKLEAEYKGLLAAHDLANGFSNEVLHESNKISLQVEPKDIEGRVDLRDFYIFTIDNDQAKDFDDAVGISRTDSSYKLWVSIADVSNYVVLGGSIDNEALRRGTSIYLPNMVIPMLPERLSNNICSLVPDHDRLTRTVEINFNRTGVMTDYKIYKSVIRSRARLTYSRVSDMLNDKSTPRRRGGELIDSLNVMKELYEKIRERRIERGELNFDIPEPELIRDELGRIVDVIKLQRNIAHGIIEEFMIAANNAVALQLFKTKTPSIYRIHEKPDINSLNELGEELKRLGYALRLKGKINVKDIQRIIFESRGRPEEIVVNLLVLRSLKRALYSTTGKGHFGLAIDHYTHFTSPIRRYPDLVVHRVIDSITNGRKTPYKIEDLDWISNHASMKERFADEVEREAIKLESANMMKAHIGKEFEGVIISILPFGFFVELKEFFVEGFIPIEKIRNRKKRNYKIGELITVKVVEANVERRRITLDLIS